MAIKYKKRGSKVLKNVKSFGVNRYYPKGEVNLVNIAKDIMLLKSIVNSEKKQFIRADGNQPIGQVDGNAEGALTLDVTPNPVQGVGDSNRVGDSIKLTTAMMKFQFRQQNAGTGPVRGIVEVWQVLGTPQSTTTVNNQLNLKTAFLTGADIRDYNAMPDQDFRNQYRLIAKRHFKVKGDTLAGQSQIQELSIPIRFGKLGTHIKYAENSTTIASGQIVMTIRVDAGNMSTTTDSTLANVVLTGQRTGIIMNSSFTFYYYDN